MSLFVRRVGHGEGPPALLLHGFTGSSAAWGDRLVDRLARGRPVLAPDLPGHGTSPPPRGPDGYRPDRILADLVRVLDRHGWEEADWIGYSMGARLALAAAVEYPERVRRLVLESGSPGLETEGARRRRRRADEALARRIEERGIQWFVDHWMSLSLFATQRELPPSTRAAERRRRLANEPAVLAATLRGAGTGRQPSYWARLGDLRLPTLILTGARDRKYEALGRRMAAAIPDAIHRSVPGVGHAVHLEAPDRWLNEVLAFLEDG